MPPRPFHISGVEIMGYRTREAYARAKGREDVAAVVSRRTKEALRKRGIRNPDPTSAVYKKEFDRLSAIYRDEQTAAMKDRKKQNAAWLAEHADDTDEQLIAYLRSVVTDLEKFKKPGSVPGGFFLTRRFGSWKKALAAARLIPPEEPHTPPEDQGWSPPEEQ